MANEWNQTECCLWRLLLIPTELLEAYSTRKHRTLTPFTRIHPSIKINPEMLNKYLEQPVISIHTQQGAGRDFNKNIAAVRRSGDHPWGNKITSNRSLSTGNEGTSKTNSPSWTLHHDARVTTDHRVLPVLESNEGIIWFEGWYLGKYSQMQPIINAEEKSLKNLQNPVIMLIVCQEIGEILLSQIISEDWRTPEKMAS